MSMIFTLFITVLFLASIIPIIFVLHKTYIQFDNYGSVKSMARKLTLSITPLEILESSGVLNTKMKLDTEISVQTASLSAGDKTKKFKNKLAGTARGSFTSFDTLKSSSFDVNKNKINQVKQNKYQKKITNNTTNKVITKFDNKIFLLGEMNIWQESMANAQAAGDFIITTMITSIYISISRLMIIFMICCFVFFTR